jgi:hypothetical protein
MTLRTILFEQIMWVLRLPFHPKFSKKVASRA